MNRPNLNQKRRNINYENPRLKVTPKAELGISSRERELLERVRSQSFKISKAELDSQDPDREVYLYTVLSQNFPDSQWHNLCQPDRDNLTKAMLLSGQWDETGKHITQHFSNLYKKDLV